jgi:hypothetical protein
MAQTIQNLAYKFVDIPDIYSVIPSDNSGNIINKITIDCDATAGDITIVLPIIGSTYAGRFTSVIVVNRLDNSLNAIKVIVDPLSSDLIGSVSEVGLRAQFDSVELQPSSEFGWSANITASNLPSSVGGLNQATLSLAQYVDLPIGSILAVIDYATSGDGATIVKISSTNGDYQDYIILATENPASTGHIGQSPI